MPIYSLRCVVAKTRLEPERFTTNQQQDPLDVRVSEYFELFLSKLLRLKDWINTAEVDVFASITSSLQRAPIPLPKTVSHISNRPFHAWRKIRKTRFTKKCKFYSLFAKHWYKYNYPRLHLNIFLGITETYHDSGVIFPTLFMTWPKIRNPIYGWLLNQNIVTPGPRCFVFKLFASTVDRLLSRISYYLSSYVFLRRRRQVASLRESYTLV